MSQPRIAEIEKPGKRRFNLETLLRIASAYGVGLEVRFVPIGTIVDHSESFDPDNFVVPTFEEELGEAERRGAVSAQFRQTIEKYVEQIAQALVASIPEQYLSHPDLKASNILIEPIAGAPQAAPQRPLSNLSELLPAPKVVRFPGPKLKVPSPRLASTEISSPLKELYA